MEDSVLVRFGGVVKIYVSTSTFAPKEHSCTFSLLKIDSDYYLQQGVGGVGRNRQKVRHGL